MRISNSAAIAAIVLMLVGCADDQPVNVELKPDPDQKNTALLHWRAGHQCDNQMRWWWDGKEEVYPCSNDNKDLITVSLSGGGTKAAIFSAESMFYLDAIGLLPRVSMISSVSGGSFASAFYALSCDVNDLECPSRPTSNGQPRPVWDYNSPPNPDDPNSPNQGAFQYIGHGFQELLDGAKWRLLTNYQDPVSPSAFAAFIDQKFLGSKITQSDVEHSLKVSDNFTFQDLNRRRPKLVLNTTLIDDLRFLSENTVDYGYGLGFLRRRNADEYYHFAFTDYYFGRIESDWGKFPLGYAVAASGAFPMLIGTPLLKDFSFCDSLGTPSTSGGPRTGKSLTFQECEWNHLDTMHLTDGGANDNQGLLEVFLTYAELLNDESRSANSKNSRKCDHLASDELSLNTNAANSGKPDDQWLAECLKGRDRGLALVVNSSITEATGESLTGTAVLKTLVGTADRVSAAIDVYSGGSYNLRKRLFKSDLDAANWKIHEPEFDQFGNQIRPGLDINVDIVEIGLLTLDDYPEGGREAALLELALLDQARTGGKSPVLPQLDINALQAIGADRGHTANCLSPKIARKPYDPPPCQTYEEIQSAAFKQTVRNRGNLGLDNVHPQCLFEQSKFTEMGLTSLAHMEDRFDRCLRQAARFATALRGEELCQRTKNGSGFYTPLNDTSALRCKDYHLMPLTGRALEKFSSLKKCEMDDSEGWQQIKVRTNLITNKPFVNELRKGMGGTDTYTDKSINQITLATWQEKWKEYFSTPLRSTPPSSAEDFIANYPLSQVCDLRLYKTDLSR